MREPESYALVGGRHATRPVEVADDPAALDGPGFWVVVGTFEGRWTCVRFDRVTSATGERRPRARPWRGLPSQRWSSSLSARQYQAAVSTIRDLIAAGEVYQVNLCRVVSTPLAGSTHLDGLHALVTDGNPAPHAARVLVPDAGLDVVSASPELFLRRQGSTVTSSPIKGTGRTVADLGSKDVAENVMIVDLVRNDLGRVCEAGSVVVTDALAVEEHPGLVHLVSTVTGRLQPGTRWADLLAATFPPGSVSGAPKSSALTAIGALEQAERGPYCGAIGWVDGSTADGELAVGIRTFWRSDGRLMFGTGAGITWGSDPLGEWRETELKAGRLLGLAAQEWRTP